MKIEDEWILTSVLPNFIFEQAFNEKYICLTHSQDDRLMSIRNKYSPIDELLDSFIDTRLNKIQPSVILLHKKLYRSRKRHEAVIAFRNLIALTIILGNWIPVIGHKNAMSFSIYFSEYFDLFPLSGYNSKLLFLSTPALSSTMSSTKNKFQSSYYLPSLNMIYSYVDEEIYSVLFKIWENYYVKRQETHFYSSLFRSFEIAFSASKMTLDNQSTVYDIGVKLGLWISAIETMFHPGGDKEIHLHEILFELNQFDFIDNKNSSYKSYFFSNKKKYEINLVAKIYLEMYKARNDFFHGNPIKIFRLYLFNDKRFPPLIQIAPLIYLIALKINLKKNGYLNENANGKFMDSLVRYTKRTNIEDIFTAIVKKIKIK